MLVLQYITKYRHADHLAEEVGFEPTVGVNPRRFSRPVHSTTLPLLRPGSDRPERAILEGKPSGAPYTPISAQSHLAPFHEARQPLTCRPKRGVTRKMGNGGQSLRKNKGHFMGFSTFPRAAVLLGGVLLLGACEGGNLPGFLQNNTARDAAPAQAGSTRLVERDVEAPEVFQKTESGLWDGRPSLGGVWIAHPDVSDPERVIIRNEDNGKFVIGALFRREREVPGPKFQVSSDAANALGMLAGQPARLSVTALRREEVGDPAASTGDETLPAPDAVEQASLDDPIAAAAAALDAAEGITPAAPAAAPSAAATSGALSKPFIQIGIFSVEQNAKNTSAAMRGAGMIASIIPGTSSGKQFWRVVVGPATSASERAALLKKIKELGFSDAYFVTN